MEAEKMGREMKFRTVKDELGRRRRRRMALLIILGVVWTSENETRDSS